MKIIFVFVIVLILLVSCIKNTDPIQIYELVKNSFIDQGVVFCGGFAVSTYSHYMPKNERKKLSKQPDFDVLSENPENTANIVITLIYFACLLK